MSGAPATAAHGQQSPVVTMRRDGADYVVAVEPDDPLHPPQTFPDKRIAWGAAGGLRLVLGLPKVDLTGEGQ